MSKTSKATNDMIEKMNKMNKKSESVAFDFTLEKYGVSKYMLHDIELEKLENAPDEWNFYKKLDDGKMKELVESILENGLLSPIVVWEIEDNKYMILAGHNRVRAYEFLKVYLDDYDKIPAIVYKKDDLDEDSAKMIIIDSNWVARELSKSEKAKSIFRKFEILGRKEHNGDQKKTRDIIAKEYDMSGRNVDKYKRINNLINEFKEKVDTDILSIDAGARLSVFEPERQQWLYNTFGDILRNSKILAIKSTMDKDEIEFVLSKKENIATIKIEIPKKQHKMFKEKFSEWIEQNNFDIKVK